MAGKQLCPALLFLVFTAQAAGKCTKINSCACKLDNGLVIDLTPLGRSDHTARFKDQKAPDDYYYSYNPCFDFSEGGDCDSVSACQKTSSGVGGTFYDLGDQSTAKFIMDGDDVILQYTGSGKQDPTIRTTKVTLKCATTPGTDILSIQGESPALTYNFELTSQHCCGTKDSGHSGGGLSVGSILCIVALVLVVVYAIGGVLFMKFVKHEEGSDLVPNKGFWVSLPSYIKEGFLFMISPCRKQGNYSNI